MKKWSLFLALLLACALALPAFAEPTVNPPGEFPIVTEPITLRMTVGQGPAQPEFKDIQILKNFEEKSGIHIEWDNVPSSMLTERRNIIFASMDLPDAMMRMNIPALDQTNYASQGILLPLDDLIEQYAPNIMAWFEKYPELPLGLRLDDGHIYTLPYIYDSPALTCGQRAFFPKDALDAVGMEVPTTLDGYYDLLKAFKELDYNGNGVKDEYPLSVTHYQVIEWFLKGSFGLGTRGCTRHEYVDIDPETGSLRFQYTTERYKELLQYMNKLYTDGLIDPEIFTYPDDGDLAQLIAKIDDGRAISYLFLNHVFAGQKAKEQAVGMYEPFEGPHGDKMFTYFGSVLNGASGAGGTFAIMKDNPYPEATIRWVDYWYSDEGIREFFMGIEGVTYDVIDGEYVYKDEILNPKDTTFEQAISQYAPWVTVSNPSVAHSDYFKGGEMVEPAFGSALALHEYAPEIIWPALRLSADLAQEMNAIQNDLKTYRNENRVGFITGSKSFDEWDAYVKGFESLGLDRYMEIYQEFIDAKGWK